MNTLLAKSRAGLTILLLLTTMTLTSCGSEDGKNKFEIPGVEGPILTNIQDQGLLIALVFENLVIDGGIRYPLPEYENSYLALEPDAQSGGTLMSIYIDYGDIFDNERLKLLPPEYLPGGRPLPGLAEGRLPAIAFSTPEFYDLSFYLGNQIYGMFIPVNVGIQQAIATFRFYSAGQRVGNVSLVGTDENDENAGILIMLDLNSRAAKYVTKKVR